ncbi:hypothetical protein [Cellulomonas fimi]|uniref:Glycosyltransferase RgtA/B/C/D-like domain-containing protein n=1 Tax=Cellulomonas fimi TaxID=1708 RepID=A0A7Y0LZA5_CELFI|nr:hypothetical protein [Cellulomonas fimi]NMR20860.1 hypothetical protein [Cellulomonas fimi]
MVSVVETGLLALLVLGLLGWAALAPLARAHRDLLLPAAPVLGAALLCVVLSTTAWFVDAGGGLVVTAAVAVALVVVGLRRSRRPWRSAAGGWAGAAVGLLVGSVGAAVALLPSAWVGDGRAMSPNASHDIYYYVAEAAWLAENTLASVPEPGAVPGAGNAVPADVPMRSSLILPLRIGQPMVHAALGELTGQGALGTAMVVMALWVLLVAPAALVTGRLLRLGRGASTALALVSVTSAILLQQVYQQNVDALLGVSLALLTVGTCIAAAERRLALWPAALTMAGLVGVYTEYALFVVPAVAGGILLRRPAGLGRRLARLLAVVGVAVLVAPTSWWRGIGVLLVQRDADALGSPFFSDGWYAAVSRVVGTSAIAGPLTGSRATLPLVLLVVLGWVLAVLLDRYRGAWLLLLGVGLGYIGFLTVEHRGYSQMRSASLLLPLLLVVTVAGWSALLRSLRRSRRVPRAARVAVASGLVLSVAVWAFVNLRSAPAGLDRGYAASRHVDETYDEAAAWVDELGGREGEDVTVAAPDFVHQLWLSHLLRDDELVSYVSLRPDYLGVQSYWAGESDRYVLVGPGAALDATGGTVVEQNERFTLVDMSAGPVVVTVPRELVSWVPYAQPDGSMIGPDGGDVAVLRSAGTTGAVELMLGVSEGPGTPVRVTVAETGRSVTGAVGGTGVGTVVVDLAALPVATLDVDLGADGVTSATTFTLIGATRVP